MTTHREPEPAGRGLAAPRAEVVPLRTDTLARVGARVEVPTYDRSTISVGIVHFGVGGFHRAHQAMYLDRLLDRGEARDFGICGVGVMPGDAAIAEALLAQDHCYTLVVKRPDGRHEARVIGSIVRYLYAPADPAAVVAQLADPRVRIVSLTITEGGYHYNQVTGEFDPADPAIHADLAGGVPTTAFGLIVAGLAARRDRGIAPFTVMSCDNIQGNGDLARRMLTAFASLRDAELGSWVSRSVSFPNSMVDRITPTTTDDDRAEVARRFGIADAWPVVTEPFSQWVLEDSFPLGRPSWERVGAMLVDDVRPYELMKLRLLNVSHQALAYFAHLCGYRFVHEAVADPLIRGLLVGYMRTEGVPTLSPVPGIDLAAYQDELIERLSNPEIGDTVARLAAESSDRIPKWLVPTVIDNLAAGRQVPIGAAIVASWARYAEGSDEQGRPIDVVDRLAHRLVPIARRQHEDPLAFLRQPDLFGDLAGRPAFTEPFRWALDRLHRQGARSTLAAMHDDGRW